MFAQTPRSETATIAGNDQQFVSSDLHSLQEKKDSVAGDDPEYATGLRLATIMSTILACTLLAALDIVSTCTSSEPV
jgi:hypothetical protein